MEFRFKQFIVKQENEVFKISTDSVLLGAWVNLQQAKNVLEVGTGTGVISLMLAQRFDVNINAIDIQEKAVALANENFQSSPWKLKICAEKKDFLDLDEKPVYDAIVSNPPYFENSLKSNNSSKMMARHLDFLPLHLMAQKIQKCLSPEGAFFVILPPESFEKLEMELKNVGLFLYQQCSISSFENAKIIRKMGAFSRKPLITKFENLYLYKNTERNRSDQYHELTKEFYL